MTPTEEREVVRTHKPFVFKHARRVRGPVEQDDMVQEGYLALVLACRSWRPDGGANIRTYASNGLRWRLLKYRDAEKKERRPLSMDEEIPAWTLHDESFSLHDVIGSVNPDLDESIDTERRAARVRAAIASLSKRHREVVERRFFNEETLEQIGSSWGRSRERIRQIEVEALDVLRKKLQGIE